MRFTKVICTIGLIALSANIFAATRSSDIQLKDLVIKPVENVMFSFDKLLPQVNYGITCTIMSDGVSNQSEDILQMQYNGDMTTIWLGDDDRIYSDQSFTMPTRQPLKLEITEVYKSSGGVIIRNLDDTDTIRVTNCVAKPYHN